MSFQDRLSDHQLQTPGSDGHQQQGHSSTAAAPLPPTDGGWPAWLFLLGSFMIEMFLWGFPFSFGVLQDYYTNHQPIARHPKGVSAVGTTCSVSLPTSPRNTLLTSQGHHVPRCTPVVRSVPTLATNLPYKHAVRSCYCHQCYHPLLLCHVCLALDPYPRYTLCNWGRLSVLPSLHLH